MRLSKGDKATLKSITRFGFVWAATSLLMNYLEPGPVILTVITVIACYTIGIITGCAWAGKREENSDETKT